MDIDFDELPDNLQVISIIRRKKRFSIMGRNPKNYENWIKKVDELFFEKFGLGYMDVEDYLWFDSFSDGETPSEAVAGFVETNQEYDI